jgi:sialic acid synthase SpsE
MVIAEISGNHNGDYTTAKQLVMAAKLAGADAVKIQMFTPDSMTIDSDKFMSGEPWNEKLYDLYKKTAMPYSWVPLLQDVAKEIDIELFTSVYDLESLSYAEELNMPRYKVSSFEINHVELLEAIAKTGKPVIVSTGTASDKEISRAIEILNSPTLLKCTSRYPANLEDLNISTIADMKERYGCKVGFSDHTVGIFAASIAVAAGAEVIEKHITLDKNGPDGSFSLTPDEFRAMVEGVRCARMCLGEITYDNPKAYRRAMVAIEPIKKGEKYSGKVKALRSLEEGSMDIGVMADTDYDEGDLIHGRKDDFSNRRDRKSRPEANQYAI